jgi:hypothetical protein
VLSFRDAAIRSAERNHLINRDQASPPLWSADTATAKQALTRRLANLAAVSLLRVVDGLGFYLVGAVVAGCSRIHRRLGDICAGTVVIEEHFGYGVKVAALAVWTAVLVGAVWCSADLPDQRRSAFSLPEPGSCPSWSNRGVCVLHGRQFPCEHQEKVSVFGVG